MSYRNQLARLVEAMSRPHGEAGVEMLADDSTVEGVRMFVEGNLDKRLDKLTVQLEFVAEAFDDFEGLLMEYIRHVPLAALDTSLTDGERMLGWLLRAKPLSAVQADYVACQRARHAVELLARSHRERHVRFQAAKRNGERPGTSERWIRPASTVRLNPIRVWTRFATTALLDDDLEPPCDVLLFADRDEIATAALEPEGRALVNLLSESEPCTIEEWAMRAGITRAGDLIEICRDLEELGAAAVEPKDEG